MYVKINGNYLTDYKLVRPNEFVLTLSEDFTDAKDFDEDDALVKMCPKTYPNTEFLGIKPLKTPLKMPLEPLPLPADNVPNVCDWL